VGCSVEEGFVRSCEGKATKTTPWSSALAKYIAGMSHHIDCYYGDIACLVQLTRGVEKMEWNLLLDNAIARRYERSPLRSTVTCYDVYARA
jgi:hypothetical protein